MIQYQYPDGSRGPARQFVHGDMRYQSRFLLQREDETDAQWAARLAAVDVTILRITPSEADPNTHDAGDPVEATNADGITEIAYPNPEAKTPIWSKTTRERMYVSAGAELPPGYTATEPGEYDAWDDAADAWAEDTDRRAAAEVAQAKRELAAIDTATIRPLRAVLAAQQAGNTPAPADLDRLAELEAQALAIRATISTED